MVAHLPDGHPEWNAVELKDLLVYCKRSLKFDMRLFFPTLTIRLFC
ncbi:hypothetical protein [Ravibacter arvi]